MQDSAKAVYLITGASRGLGAAFARAFDARGASLFLVARGSLAGEYGDAVGYRADLSDPASVPVLIEAFGEFLRTRSVRQITLINNAGTVEPIRPAKDCDIDQIDAAIRLNLLAPMALTGGFIRLLADEPIAKRVVNISSGAASTPYAGWSVYCAGKAGLDHFTRCVGLEQRDVINPTTAITLAPGIVDTDMQGVIRDSNAADFPMIEKFVDLKVSGTMAAADEVAERIARFLDTALLDGGGIYDIRDLDC